MQKKRSEMDCSSPYLYDFGDDGSRESHLALTAHHSGGIRCITRTDDMMVGKA